MFQQWENGVGMVVVRSWNDRGREKAEERKNVFATQVDIEKHERQVTGTQLDTIRYNSDLFVLTLLIFIAINTLTIMR